MSKKTFTPSTLNMWESVFDRGTLFLKQNSLSQALESFTKAIELGCKEAVVFDSRAVVLERMGQYKEALADARVVIELLPESHKGYTRSSRLFELRCRYSQAYKMLSIALPLCPPSLRETLAAKLPDLAMKRDAQQKAIEKSKRSYIKLLPYEILSSVAHYLMIDNPDSVLQLASVCQDWRNFCLYNSSLWSSLRVGRRRAIKKATAFLERSGGRIKDIWFEKVDDLTSKDLSKLLSGNLRGIVSIRINEGPGVRTVSHILTCWQGQFLPNVLKSIRLSVSSDHATSYLEDFEDHFWRLYCPWELKDEDSSLSARNVRTRSNSGRVQICTLESLRLDNVRMKKFLQVPSWLGPLPLLKSLRLSHVRVMCFDQPVDHSFQKFLLCAPNLISLMVERKSVLGSQTTVTSFPAQIIPLQKLQVLALDSCPFQYGSDLRLDHPDLEALRLCSSNSISPARHVYQSYLFEKDELPSTNMTFVSSHGTMDRMIRPKACAERLTQLILSQTRIDNESLFIRHLRFLPALKLLYVDGCNLTNRTVEALILESDGNQNWTCPRLKTLNMSYTEGISGTPICKMVASRLVLPDSSMSLASSTMVLPSTSSSRPSPLFASSSSKRDMKPNLFRPCTPSLPLETSSSVPLKFSKPSSYSDLRSSSEQKTSLNLLILDGCVDVELKAIEWLQCKVATVKSRYMDPNNPRGASRSFTESVAARQGGY
ncbi:Molecular co-chaperone STI1 [Phaffia rhodozyma]|uniref:Molecular co-chaperone STI1 n=1 Tax=Phaffia rhodozyma TaxID=264483 RepID=A0A0F7SEE4_PHARH|nr:Molecular co-chaperone STI1 [Phaffia rhodozyma]